MPLGTDRSGLRRMSPPRRRLATERVASPIGTRSLPAPIAAESVAAPIDPTISAALAAKRVLERQSAAPTGAAVPATIAVLRPA